MAGLLDIDKSKETWDLKWSNHMKLRLFTLSIITIALVLISSCSDYNDKPAEDFGYSDIGSITAVYDQSLAEIDSGGKVMILYLDGFSWKQFQTAAEYGDAAFMNEHFQQSPALSVTKPVTNAGMAAMITGTPPEINGISDRSKRIFKGTDIFEKVTGQGKSAMLIEGNSQVLNTSIEPVLNIDRNGNGTDDEVAESALMALKKDPDLIMVHFHGIDDQGHEAGPYGETTMAKIREIDGYIGQLTESFKGLIVLTADHGMHETDSGGDHGENVEEDMVVPFLIWNQNKSQGEALLWRITVAKIPN